MEWNVYTSNINHSDIEKHNVFDHYRLLEDCKKNYRKNKNDREAFLERLRRDLMYYYWSKCEWEIVIDHWPHRDWHRGDKVDVYDQVMLNWDRFCDYVWANKDEFKTKRVRKKNGDTQVSEN